MSFAAYGVRPFLFESGKTPARVMTKAIQNLQPVLYALKACVLVIELGLGELSETGEHLRKRLLRVNEHRPFPVAQNKVVGCLTAGRLALPCT